MNCPLSRKSCSELEGKPKQSPPRHKTGTSPKTKAAPYALRIESGSINQAGRGTFHGCAPCMKGLNGRHLSSRAGCTYRNLAPPGPADLRARIEAARANVAPGLPFSAFLPRRGSAPGAPSGGSRGVAALLSWPDYGTGFRPAVIRMETPDPLEKRPLMFLVRQGHELFDYAALMARIEADGPKLSAPTHRIMGWDDFELRGQFVALVRQESQESEARTNG